jgi:hypothetical protein
LEKENPFRPPAPETVIRAGALETVRATLIIPPKSLADLKADAKVLNRVLQMNGEKVARELPAEHQLIGDAWNEAAVGMPYLVYMPEKDRLLLVYHINYKQWQDLSKCSPVLSFSDDHGKTWTTPTYLRDMGFCPEGTPEEVTYLGNATALSYLGNGKLVVATGQFISERSRGFSSDYGETWRSEPLPKTSGGFHWDTWDPMWVDRDPDTGDVVRLCDTAYSDGMEKAFAGANKVVVFPDQWHWRHDPDDKGLAEAWHKEEVLDAWPRRIRIDKHWTEQGEPAGVGWYATNFEAPDTVSAPLVILFGAVDGDCDVFIDGAKVGEQKEPNEIMWNTPFHVPLDEGLGAGAHTIVIRVEKSCGPEMNAGIYLPIWIVEKPDPDAPAPPGASNRGLQAHIRFSYDEGRTWPEELQPPAWNGGSEVTVSEVALCRAANGTMIAGCRIRISRLQGQQLLDQHAGLGVSLSRDNGYTWTKVKVVHEFGRMHPSFAVMPNGDIVMAYVVRMGWLTAENRLVDEDGYPQWRVEAVVSHDHGETWDVEHRYILAKWSGANNPTSTTTALLPDGSLLTAFTSGYLSRPEPKGTGPEDSFGRQVCIVRWRPEENDE